MITITCNVIITFDTLFLYIVQFSSVHSELASVHLVAYKRLVHCTTFYLPDGFLSTPSPPKVMLLVLLAN